MTGIDRDNYDYYKCGMGDLYAIAKETCLNEAPTFAPDDWEPSEMLAVYKWDEESREFECLTEVWEEMIDEYIYIEGLEPVTNADILSITL